MEFQNGDTKSVAIHSLARIFNFPVVHDGASALQTMANNNAVGRAVLSTTHSALAAATSYIDRHPESVQAYYSSYVQPHIVRMDAVACRSLDWLQTKVPAVNKPSADLVKAIKQSPHQWIASAKGHVSNTVHVSMLPIRKATDKTSARLEDMIDHVEDIVDHYLPEPLDSSSPKLKSESGEALVVRAVGIVKTTTHRLEKRVSTGLTTFYEDMFKTSKAPAPIESIKDSLKFYQDTLIHSFTVYGEAARERIIPAVTQRLEKIQAVPHNQVRIARKQVSFQLDKVRTTLKAQQETLGWIRLRMEHHVTVAKAHLDQVRISYTDSMATGTEYMAHSGRDLYDKKIMPALQLLQSHLLQWIQLSKVSVRLPLEYLGLLAHKAQ